MSRFYGDASPHRREGRGSGQETRPYPKSDSASHYKTPKEALVEDTPAPQLENAEDSVASTFSSDYDPRDDAKIEASAERFSRPHHSQLESIPPQYCSNFIRNMPTILLSVDSHSIPIRDRAITFALAGKLS